MTLWDIAMGTIGAMIEAATHSNHNFGLFAGDFLPAARAICIYQATTQPPRLSKSIIIRTLAAAASWSLADGDFHNLEVTVTLDMQDIAFGGYGPPPFQLGGSDNLSIATS